MNKTDIELLFPENLTDEAASVLSAFLYDLAASLRKSLLHAATPPP